MRTLILEDSPEDVELVVAELQRADIALDWRAVGTETEFRSALAAFCPDVVLSDVTVPGYSGMAALQLVRQSFPDLPFIFVSGTIGEQRLIDAMTQGATDYVLKHNLARLSHAVLRAENQARERRAHRLAEQQVKESEARFRLVVDNAFDAIVVMNADGRIVDWNHAAEGMFGWRRGEAVGRSMAETIMPARYRESHTRSLERFVATGEQKMLARRMEISALRRDGTEFPIELVISPIRYRDEYIFSGAIRDITNRVRAEQALRLRERAIESSINAIIITSCLRPDYPIEYVNPAFERITGYAAAEVIGRNCRFLQGPDRAQPEIEKIRVALQEKREGRAVLRNYRKDGSVFWNELYVAPVRDAKGEVTHFVGVQNDVTAARRYQQELEHRATHDALTDLPNRAILHDRISLAIAHAQRQQRLVATVFVDLDDFKYVNDSLGHQAGDELLKSIGERLRESTRDDDTVARLGGDEFALIFADVEDEEQIATALRRIVNTFARPFELDGRELYITCSMGVSVYPRDGAEAATLLKNADIAMYRAKERGRNNFQFFTSQMNDRIDARFTLESRLRRAIERGELYLNFQPQIDVGQRAIIGAEALLRWRDPDLGLVSPARFIPVAEERGLIIPIGEWVLKQACRQARDWQDMGLRPMRVSVNVSARQLQRGDLLTKVTRALDESRLDPRWLELELTEGQVMENPEDVMLVLQALKAVGVHIAIDDFGTGYSSLNYLRRFDVNRLKIDQSFIRDITDDHDDASIAKAIISLGHSLGLKVIAEGVETSEQLDLLRSWECDEVQGYLFSRPIDAPAFAGLLRGDEPLECSFEHTESA